MEEKLKQLKADRERYRTRTFWIAVEVIFIFGVPAFIGVLLEQWIRSTYHTFLFVALIPLGFAFFISWVVIVKRVASVRKKFQEFDDKINNLS